jgi:hypothetical protein
MEGKGREGKGREGKGREGKGRERKGREEIYPIFESLPASMAIQTPALFANTREYSKHGRVYLHIYGYGCSAKGLYGEG